MAEFIAYVVVVLIAVFFGCGVFFSVFGRFFEQRRIDREAQRLEELLREDPPWERPRILRCTRACAGLWQAMVERLEREEPNDPDAVEASLCFLKDAEPRVYRDRHTGQVWVRYYVDNGKSGHAYGYWEELSPFPFDAAPPVSVLRQSR